MLTDMNYPKKDSEQIYTPCLLTVQKAAKKVGVHYRQLLEGVKNGTIPHYKVHRSRTLVSIPEIIEAMRSKGDK